MTRYEWYANKFFRKDLLAFQLTCTCCIYRDKCNKESRCKQGIKEWLDQEVVDKDTGDFPGDVVLRSAMMFKEPWW